MKKQYCPMVTNGLEIRSAGYVSPCCVTSKIFTGDDGVDFKISDDQNITDAGEVRHVPASKISEIWNSKDRLDFVANFDTEFHTYCKACKDIEESGGTSKRMQEIKNFGLGEDNGEIYYLDIKMGNTCNLICTMCGPWASSKWANTYRQLGKRSVRVEQWQESDNFWDQLPEFAHSIRRLEISGGEPFLIKKQEKLIKYLVDNDLAKNIDVLWITNCTVWPEYLVGYIKEFKVARVMLSLDNTHKQFEYIRYPAKWKPTYEIFLKFKELHANGDIILGISHSITLLNIWHLPDFIQWCRDHKVDVYNNMVHNFLCVKDLPLEFKQKVAERLETITVRDNQSNPVVGKDNWLTQYMMQSGDYNSSKKYHDEYIITTRGREAFEQAFPELKDYF